MAARVNKIRHDQNTRAKIQASMIVNRLQEHIAGNVDMGATQVSAALGLLRKTLPDLAQVDSTLDANMQGSVTFTWQAPDSTPALAAEDDDTPTEG
jgi:hypothetical protein